VTVRPGGTRMPGANSFGVSPVGFGVVAPATAGSEIAGVPDVADALDAVDDAAPGADVAGGAGTGADVACGGVFGGAVTGAETPRGTNTANPTTMMTTAAGTDQVSQRFLCSFGGIRSVMSANHGDSQRAARATAAGARLA
jgi:hypothetical protein